MCVELCYGWNVGMEWVEAAHCYGRSNVELTEFEVAPEVGKLCQCRKSVASVFPGRGSPRTPPSPRAGLLSEHALERKCTRVGLALGPRRHCRHRRQHRRRHRLLLQVVQVVHTNNSHPPSNYYVTSEWNSRNPLGIEQLHTEANRHDGVLGSARIHGSVKFVVSW